MAFGLLASAGYSHAEADRSSPSSDILHDRLSAIEALLQDIKTREEARDHHEEVHDDLLEELDTRFDALHDRLSATEALLQDIKTREEARDHHEEVHDDLLEELDARFDLLHDRLSGMEVGQQAE